MTLHFRAVGIFQISRHRQAKKSIAWLMLMITHKGYSMHSDVRRSVETIDTADTPVGIVLI